MVIHHHNNSRLKVMDLPHLKATGLLHKATDHRLHRDILHRMGIRTLCPSLPSPAFANLKTGPQAFQAIHLLKVDLHPSQAMEGMVRRRRSSHQDRTVEDTNRYSGFSITIAYVGLIVVQDTTARRLGIRTACTWRTTVRRSTR